MNEQKKPHLSYSQLSMLWTCGERYRFRYIEGIKRPPGVASVIGRATHRSVDANLTSWIKSRQHLSLEQVKDIARDAVESTWSEGIDLSSEEKALGEKAVKGEVIDQSISLSELHAIKVAPNIDPTHVERKFVLELDGYPYDLMGFIDIQEGIRVVRDLKTKGKSPSAGEADDSLQLTMYGLGVKVCDGQFPEKLTLDTLVKAKTPKLVVQETERKADDYKMLFRRIERAIEVIDRDAFTPADPSSWQCSERWCGYWNVCKFARRPVTVAVP